MAALGLVQEAVHEPEFLESGFGPAVLRDDANDLLAKWCDSLRVLAEVDESVSEGCGSRVDSSQSETQLAGNIVDILAVSNLVHPADSVFGLRELLPCGKGLLRTLFAESDFRRDEFSGIPDVRADASALVDKPVIYWTEDRRDDAHLLRCGNTVDRVVLCDIEPFFIAAQGLSEEHARVQPRDKM